MGCWNKTCGLTRLPIFHGEDTYVFVIEQNNDPTSRCDTHALWQPFILPFEAKYNDYGAGEDWDKHANFIVNGVANNLIEQEVGDNKYHDIAVKREGFGPKQFFEACHEGRLYRKDWQSNPAQMDFVMMRKASVQYVLNNWKLKQYVGEGKGNRPDDKRKYSPNSYHHYMWADIVAQVPEVVQSMRDQLTPDPNDEYGLMMKKMMGFERMFEWNSPVIAARMLAAYGRGGTGYSNITTPHDAIYELVEKGELKEAEEVVTRLLLGLFINNFMSSTRLIWAPGCHEGSQSDAESEYEVLAGALTQGVKDRKAMYDEDEE